MMGQESPVSRCYVYSCNPKVIFETRQTGDWSSSLFNDDDLLALDPCPLYVLVVLVPVPLIGILDESHLNLVFAFRAVVPERRGYLHVAAASIASHFHTVSPWSPFLQLDNGCL
jgi:hypothetical protein